MFRHPPTPHIHPRWITLIMICCIAAPIYGQKYLGAHIGGLGIVSFEDQNVSSYDHLNITDPSTFYFGFSYRNRKEQRINLTYNLDYQLIKSSANNYGRGNCLMCSSIEKIDMKIHSLIFRVLPEFTYKGKVTIYWNVGPYIGLAVKATEQGSLISEYEDYGQDPIDGSLVIEIKESIYQFDRELKDIGYWEVGGSTTLGIGVPLSDELDLNMALNYSVGYIQNSRRENEKMFLKDDFRLDDFWLTIGLQKQLFEKSD